jgi:dTDP-3-amino-3,4,6-trideoxy-alpha-D-glucose transaminase
VSLPLFDTASMLAPLRGEFDQALKRILDSGRFVLGSEVAAFERELAAYCGAAHAVGVANGTDAITIALRDSPRRSPARVPASAPVFEEIRL